MILGMANRSLVISEPIYKPAPFVPGEHYVEAEVREMPELLSYYRAHPAERADIVDRAYRFVTQELRMVLSTSKTGKSSGPTFTARLNTSKPCMKSSL